VTKKALIAPFQFNWLINKLKSASLLPHVITCSLWHCFA